MNKITNNPIAISIQLARAVEIALLGGHSISVFANTDYAKANEDFIKARGEYSNLMDGCNFVKGGGNINLELVRPAFSDLINSKYEATDKIVDRVLLARNNKGIKKLICDSSTSLLKTAYERLGLGVKEIHNIVDVASTIARLDSSSKIEPQHIAEAIQYNCLDKEELIELG